MKYNETGLAAIYRTARRAYFVENGRRIPKGAQLVFNHRNADLLRQVFCSVAVLRFGRNAETYYTPTPDFEERVVRSVVRATRLLYPDELNPTKLYKSGLEGDLLLYLRKIVAGEEVGTSTLEKSLGYALHDLKLVVLEGISGGGVTVTPFGHEVAGLALHPRD